jgi:phage anti-repressor protein
MKDLVLKLFLEKRYSAFYIQLETGLSFSEITHYIRCNTEAKERHKKALIKQKEFENAQA